MQSAVHDTHSHKKNFTSPPTSKRPYVFLLIFLTVFVLSLIFWRTPIHGYVAKATIALKAQRGSGHDGAKLPSRDELQAEITSESFVRWALELAAIGAGPPTERKVAKVCSLLQVSLSGSKTPSQAQIDVRFVGASPSEAIDVVSRISQHYVAAHAPQNSHSMLMDDHLTPEEKQSIQQAQNDESAAHESLDGFLDQHFDELSMAVRPKEREDMTASESRGSRSAATDQTSEPTGLSTNPDWLKLQAQVNDLANQYDRLMLDRTSQHPQVQQLALSIERLKNELEQVPQFLEVPTPAVTPSAVEPPAGAEKTAQPMSGRRLDAVKFTQSVGKYRKLQSRYALAHKHLDESARTVLHRSAYAGEESHSFVGSMIEPGRIIGRLGGTPSVLQLVWIAIGAVGVGSLVAWACVPTRAATVFFQIDEVEKRLGIPVAGAISTDDGPRLNIPSQARTKIVAMITRACEATLAVIIFFIMIIAVFDSPIAAGFADDPFGTLSEVVSRFATNRF